MTVYIDTLKKYPLEGKSSQVQRVFANGSCHMWADTLQELLMMADLIGLQRSWLQHPKGFPHFDLNESRRSTAIRYGVVVKSLRDTIRERRAL